MDINTSAARGRIREPGALADDESQPSCGEGSPAADTAVLRHTVFVPDTSTPKEHGGPRSARISGSPQPRIIPSEWTSSATRIGSSGEVVREGELEPAHSHGTSSTTDKSLHGEDTGLGEESQPVRRESPLCPMSSSRASGEIQVNQSSRAAAPLGSAVTLCQQALDGLDGLPASSLPTPVQHDAQPCRASNAPSEVLQPKSCQELTRPKACGQLPQRHSPKPAWTEVNLGLEPPQDNASEKLESTTIQDTDTDLSAVSSTESKAGRTGPAHTDAASASSPKEPVIGNTNAITADRLAERDTASSTTGHSHSERSQPDGLFEGFANAPTSTLALADLGSRGKHSRHLSCISLI